MSFPERYSYHELTSLPIPPLEDKQLELITPELVRAKQPQKFDFERLVGALQRTEHASAEFAGRKIAVADIGGTKIETGIAVVEKDGKIRYEHLEKTLGNDGDNYLDKLQELSTLASRERVDCVGISTAGEIRGTKLLTSINAPRFLESFARYNNDFQQLFESVSVVNDGVAALIGGSEEMLALHPETKNVVCVLRGTGLGGGVMKDQSDIVATEIGHVPVISVLNPFGVETPCGMGGAEFVCLERVAGSGTGDEPTWELLNGVQSAGVDIANRFLAGDPLPRWMYSNSALIAAHAAIGMSKNLLGESSGLETAFVLHGGGVKIRGWGERVKQIVDTHTGLDNHFIETQSSSHNACLDGAVYAALIQ